MSKRHDTKSLARTRCLRLLALACLLFVLTPAVANAGQVTYAQGYYGLWGQWSTSGNAPRSWNRVWRDPGITWALWYKYTNGTVTGYWQDTMNPTVSPYSISYGTAWCAYGDDTGILWTCQTTN